MKKRILIISILVICVFIAGIFIFKSFFKEKENIVFKMYISDVYVDDKDNTTYVTGTIEEGVVKATKDAEIVGLTVNKTKVKKIYLDKKEVKEAKKGDFVSIAVDSDYSTINRGMMLASKDLVKPVKVFKLSIERNNVMEDLIIEKTTDLVFRMGTEDYAGEVINDTNIKVLENGTIEVELDDKAPIYKDLDVVVKYDGKTVIGTGKVVEIVK